MARAEKFILPGIRKLNVPGEELRPKHKNKFQP